MGGAYRRRWRGPGLGRELHDVSVTDGLLYLTARSFGKGRCGSLYEDFTFLRSEWFAAQLFSIQEVSDATLSVFCVSIREAPKAALKTQEDPS
jgi:hypothetical protein